MDNTSEKVCRIRSWSDHQDSHEQIIPPKLINEIYNYEYEDEGKVIQRGKKSFFRHQWKTINNPAITVAVEFGKRYRLRYLEYDYIGHQFYVEASEMQRPH